MPLPTVIQRFVFAALRSFCLRKAPIAWCSRVDVQGLLHRMLFVVRLTASPISCAEASRASGRAARRVPRSRRVPRRERHAAGVTPAFLGSYEAARPQSQRTAARQLHWQVRLQLCEPPLQACAPALARMRVFARET